MCQLYFHFSAWASQAALLMFFDTLRVEFGSDVKITIVTPGFIESELTQGKFLGPEGKMKVDQDIMDLSMHISLTFICSFCPFTTHL